MPSPESYTWRGTGVALVTPFTANHQVDLPALRQLVDDLIAGGVDYLVPLGTTGESATLTEDEALAVVDTVLETNAGRRPVLLGCGGNDTRAVAQKLDRWSQRFAVQGFLSVSPYYNKPTQEGIYQHYRALTQACPLPLVLYNVPGRTGSNLLPETALRLAHEFPSIVGIKEASGNLEQGARIIRDQPPHFRVISGDDALALPGIAVGMVGVISVIGNAVPSRFSRLIRAVLAGDGATAQRLHAELLPLTELCFREGNPAGVKAARAALGKGSAAVRLPLVAASAALQAELAAALQKLPEAE